MTSPQPSVASPAPRWVSIFSVRGIKGEYSNKLLVRNGAAVLPPF